METQIHEGWVLLSLSPLPLSFSSSLPPSPFSLPQPPSSLLPLLSPETGLSFPLPTFLFTFPQ